MTTQPKTIHAILDIDRAEGKRVYELHGTDDNGVPIMVQEQRDQITATDTCDVCGDGSVPLYVLADADFGVPTCRVCLEDYDWVTDTVPADTVNGVEDPAAVLAIPTDDDVSVIKDIFRRAYDDVQSEYESADPDTRAARKGSLIEELKSQLNG